MNTENLDNQSATSNDNIVVADKLAKSQTRGPGSRLRNAREARQLTVEDVARKLFLTTTVVEQIETDNYQKTPALTFMKGYLRSYARIVGVSEDSVIAEFNSLNLQDKPASMSIQNIYKNKRQRARKSMKWFSILVAVVFIVAIVFWVHAEFSSNETTVTANNAALDLNTATNDSSTGTVTAPLTSGVTVSDSAATNSTATNSAVTEPVVTNTAATKTETKQSQKTVVEASKQPSPKTQQVKKDQRSQQQTATHVAEQKKTEHRRAEMSSPF